MTKFKHYGKRESMYKEASMHSRYHTK